MRVIVMDSHEASRLALTQALEQQGMSVRQAGDVQEVWRLLKEGEKPDVLVIDTSTVTEEMKSLFSQVKTIILVPYPDYDALLQSIHAGVRGYYLRGSPRRVVDAVAQIAGGRYALDERVLGEIGTAPRLPPHFQICSPLSKRETQILELMARGYRNGEIAQELGLALQTVKNHIRSIMRKLSAPTRSKAVLCALAWGWITLNPWEGSPHGGEN
mgnify:CR=1 FL=1